MPLRPPTITTDPPATPPPASLTEADLLAGGPGQTPLEPAPVATVTPPTPPEPTPAPVAPAPADDLDRRIAAAVAAAIREAAPALRAPAPAAEPPAPALPPKPDPQLALSDPSRYQAEYDAYRDALEGQRLDARERKIREELATRDREAERQAAWRDEVAAFYARHPDLDTEERRPYANAVYSDLYQRDAAFRALPVRDALDRAATETKRRLLTLTQGAKAEAARPAPHLEHSGPRAPAAPAPADAPHSLSAAIHDIQRRRREARLGRRQTPAPSARA